MSRLEFFFDLTSPYSYLAATQLPALAARAGAVVSWRPMVLGGVFKGSHNASPASVAAKSAYMLADLARWSAYYQVPLRFNSRFPVNAISAMRLILVAEEIGKGPLLTELAFRAVWAEDRDVSAPAELTALAQAAGLPEGAEARIGEQGIKDRLRANTDEAVHRGAFGAPAMFVGDELFWGNDRLHFVEAALKALKK